MTMKAISDDPINTCFIAEIDYSKVVVGPVGIEPTTYRL